MVSGTGNRISLRVYWVVFACGTALLLVNAFHGYIWFDESYSIAIAKFSFADIWSINANDVHPVLSYWALHVLYLLFGQNILVYRLFSVVGALALASLGIGTVRKLFGDQVGLTFEVLALFTPYIGEMAVQIRMYSWVTFFVALCALYGYRIFLALQARFEDGVTDAGTRIPWQWWAVFFASSLTCAYLHYFGTISAFLINVALFVYLVVHHRSFKRETIVFVIGAVAQIALFMPWMFALIKQLSAVSSTYWAMFYFPYSLIELFFFPVMPSTITYAMWGSYGIAYQVAVIVLIVALTLLTLVVFANACRRIFEMRKQAKIAKTGFWRCLREWHRNEGRPALAFMLFFGLYLGMIAVVIIAYLVSGSYMLYYRYLFVDIGPIFISCAILFTYAHPNEAFMKKATMALCVIIVCLGCCSQSLFANDDYDPANQAPLDYFEQTVESIEEETGQAPLILSSDIGFMGVTAVDYPDITQTYMMWQKGNWDEAYRCYEPALERVSSWEEALEGYEGPIVVLGQSANANPRTVNDLQTKPGVSLVSVESFWRPYERTYFTIAVMQRSE